MVANNAFMIEEMKQKVRKETRKQERENTRLKDVGRVKSIYIKEGGVKWHYQR